MSLLDRINAHPLPFAATARGRVRQRGARRRGSAHARQAGSVHAGRVAHGGAIMSFADTLGGAAAFIGLPAEAKGTTTLESKTNFIAGAPAGSTLIGRCSLVHRGRRTQVWQTRVETEDGKLIALTSQTQMIL